MLDYDLNQNKSNLDTKKIDKDPTDLDSTLPIPEQKPKPKPTSFWQIMLQGWNNLSFQTKLTILLVSSATLPVIFVTQSLVTINKDRALNDLKETLQQDGKAFAEEYVLWTQVDSQAKAESLAQLVQATNLDLNNPGEISVRRAFLQNFLKIQNGSDPELNKNFQIFTDAQGRTVAQDIQILNQDSSNPLPAKDKALTAPKYRSVSLPVGIYLGDIPIVKNALRTGSPLAGIELLKREPLQRLGLEKQADIGLRTQPTQNLPESKQPFANGTYDVEGGKAGLVSVAVYPIKIENKLVGTVIVGAVLNQNYGLVDKFSQNYKVPVATVFAQDWRVSTNVPYTDGQTRAIGTRAAREVAARVLNQGQNFSGQTNIVGKQYFTFYSPLYDHQKILNPDAKAVGMAFVGDSLVEVESRLREQQLLAYGIGGGLLLLVGLAAIPVANSFSRSLRRLASFTQQVGAGEQGVRLESTDRQDEIGVLSQELNQMVARIESNFATQRQAAERAQLFADIASSRSRESQELELVFNKAVTGAREILKAERVVIYRFNPDWSGYISTESVVSGWPQALADKIEDPCIGDNLIEAYRNGRVVPTDNVFEAGFHPEHLKLMERLQIKANLVTPIVNNDRLFGLLIAHHCSNTHAWQQSEIDFLVQLAAQLGLILDRTSLLEQQQAEAERARLIKDITVKLALLTQIEDIFDTAVREIRLALKSDRVVVYSFNSNWQGTVVAESVADGWPRALGAEINDPCFAEGYVEKYRQGRVQATENIYNVGLTECHIKQLAQFAVKANLVAPILRGGQLLGLLIAHQCSKPRAWQQGEIDLIAQLATQVGFTLDRASLLEQQKTAKEQIQKRALELLIEVDPISRGDLTIRANVTDDEIGTVADSYNATVSSLRKIVTQVQAAARQVTVTTSSNEISVSGLSQEALLQAQEIAVALERIQEMSHSIHTVAVNASQAEAAVQQANQTVEAGDAAMNRTVEGIFAVRETVAETSIKVKRLGESSQKISKVVKLISSFTEQTNLLALNAAIEAARAGEEGRGFAVVADEVQSLASQSAQATAEIESLVTEIQAETKEVVVAMQAGSEQVAEGTKLVDETRQSLNEITAVSAQIGVLVKAIAAATVVQSQASEQVTQTISDVAASASKNSNSATLVSASFKELLAVATELQASAGQFKVN